MPGRVILAVAMLTMLIGALVTAPLGAGDDALVVDLLPQRIEVDSSFTGSTVILFGVKTVPGDIIVTLRGPEAPVVVRRKRRVAGIWVNRDSVAFRDVPQYYALAASRHMHQYGTKREQLAEVAVAAREWAKLNPKAFRQEEIGRAHV